MPISPAPLSGFDPADLDAWTVLADWLTERGDVRGLMIALETSGSDQPQLDQLRRQHLPRYAEALWRIFAVRSEAELNRRVELRWRAGLILATRPIDPSESQLEALLASEAAVALAELQCDALDPRLVVEVLARGPARPSLRKLVLGDYRTPMPTLERLWPKLPGLRELELCGPGIHLAGLARALPHLAHLRLCCELDPTPLQCFADSTFASLRILELRLGGNDYFRRIEPLALVIGGRSTPALEHLAITGVAFGDALVDALASSPLLDRLAMLDLSDSLFTPFASSLVSLDRPGLRRLSLRGSDHSPRARADLRRHFDERLD